MYCLCKCRVILQTFCRVVACRGAHRLESWPVLLQSNMRCCKASLRRRCCNTGLMYLQKLVGDVARPDTYATASGSCVITKVGRCCCKLAWDHCKGCIGLGARSCAAGKAGSRCCKPGRCHYKLGRDAARLSAIAAKPDCRASAESTTTTKPRLFFGGW